MMARMISSSSTIRMEAVLASLSGGRIGFSGHGRKAFERGGEFVLQGRKQGPQGVKTLFARDIFYFPGACGEPIGAQRRGAGLEAVGDAPQLLGIAGGELLVE